MTRMKKRDKLSDSVLGTFHDCLKVVLVDNGMPVGAAVIVPRDSELVSIAGQLSDGAIVGSGFVANADSLANFKFECWSASQFEVTL